MWLSDSEKRYLSVFFNNVLLYNVTNIILECQISYQKNNVSSNVKKKLIKYTHFINFKKVKKLRAIFLDNTFVYLKIFEEEKN